MNMIEVLFLLFYFILMYGKNKCNNDTFRLSVINIIIINININMNINMDKYIIDIGIDDRSLHPQNKLNVCK